MNADTHALTAHNGPSNETPQRRLPTPLRPTQMLLAHPEVWLVTGTGRHVAARGHQKTAEGGVLRAAVEEYLQRERERNARPRPRTTRLGRLAENTTTRHQTPPAPAPKPPQSRKACVALCLACYTVLTYYLLPAVVGVRVPRRPRQRGALGRFPGRAHRVMAVRFSACLSA
eukprot:scaffold18638_cov66-Phaeocystis_antarctica.AAC.4